MADCTRGLRCADCDAGLQVKALFRRAKARQMLGDAAGHVADLRRAQAVEPHNSTVSRELLQAAAATGQRQQEGNAAP